METRLDQVGAEKMLVESELEGRHLAEYHIFNCNNNRLHSHCTQCISVYYMYEHLSVASILC